MNIALKIVKMTYKKHLLIFAKLYKVKLGSYRWRSTKQNSEKENQVQKILILKSNPFSRAEEIENSGKYFSMSLLNPILSTTIIIYLSEAN